MRRPETHEYNAYYGTYIDRVPGGDLFEVMSEAPDALESLMRGAPPDFATFAYADGKWTVSEVLGHVLDTERMFTYRALHIARGDDAPLPGMDQDVWAAHSNAGSRPISDLLDEFRALRSASVRLLASFDDEMLARRGLASGFEVTPRAIAFIVAGHEIHHRGVLEERYRVG